MALASCQRCKKLYQKIRSNICPTCEIAEEEDYEKVRKFLGEFPNRNAEQVSEETGVPIDSVLRFIDAGRVEAVGITGTSTVKCGRCGAPAISTTKKLCEACLQALNAELARSQSQIKLPKKKGVEVGKALNTFHDVAGKDGPPGFHK